MLKQHIKIFIRTACVLALLGIRPAYAIDYIQGLVPGVQKVGEARMTYLLWDLYDVVLYAPKGVWNKNQPFALQLSYLRSFHGKKIADHSIEEIRNQGFTDEIKLATWHAQMRKIFPDVDEGVHLTGVRTQKGETVFYKNNLEIGRINNPEFSKVFFDIWLHEKTSAPNVRQRLLGTI